MSLKNTLSTEHWKTIPKKCKNCSKAIYTIENGKVFYQCSLFGIFKKDCNLQLTNRQLLKPEDLILENK